MQFSIPTNSLTLEISIPTNNPTLYIHMKLENNRYIYIWNLTLTVHRNIADSFQLKTKDINHTSEHSLKYSFQLRTTSFALSQKLSSTKLARLYILLVIAHSSSGQQYLQQNGRQPSLSNQSQNNHNFGLSEHMTTHNTHTKCIRSAKTK